MKCPKCYRPVPDLTGYRTHYFMGMCGIGSESTVPCPDCARIFSLWNSLYKHYKREHGEGSETAGNNGVVMETVPPTSSLDKNLLQLAAKYYGNAGLTRKVVSEVFSDLKNVMNESLIPMIHLHYEDNRMSRESTSSICSTVNSVMNQFTSELHTMNRFRSLKTLIDPESYHVGTHSDYVKRRGVTLYQPVNCVAHRIPLKETFLAMFSLNGVLTSTLSYMSKLMGESDESDVKNFVQGSYWRSRISNNPGKIMIPYFVFYDEFESGGALGNDSCVHKLGAVYIMFPSLAVDFPSGTSVSPSGPNKIILAALFHSSDRFEFGNEAILGPVIDEMNELSGDGISFNLPDFTGTVYFEVGLISGDNASIHSLCGFDDSFLANRCCRTCRADKTECGTALRENTLMLRDMSNYRQDLDTDDPAETGVKERCVWLNLRNFDLFSQIGVDIMSDIIEGCGKHVMGLLMKKYVVDLAYFTMDEFNERLEAFDFGPDNSAKPVAMSLDCIRKNMVLQSPLGMANLIRYFGLLVGDIILEKTPGLQIYGIWNLYESLFTLVDEAMDTIYHPKLFECTKVFVSELNEVYLDFSDSKQLPPEMHFLIHYPRAIMKFGPLSLISLMHSEAKQCLLKAGANLSTSKAHVTAALAKKHQLVLNRVFVRGGFSDPLKVVINHSRPFNYESYASVLSSLKIEGDPKSGRFVQSATFYNYIYRKGTVVAADVWDEQYVFMKITDILYFEQQQLVFVGVPLQSLGFWDRVLAHEVQVIQGRKIAVFHKNLCLPTPCNYVILPNKEHFVSIRRL